MDPEPEFDAFLQRRHKGREDRDYYRRPHRRCAVTSCGWV
jgi:hypothetical protein